MPRANKYDEKAYQKAYYQRHKARLRKAHGAWIKAHPGCHTRTAKRSALKLKYGITEAEYERLRAAQDYRCAICRVHESESGTLAVDHCHTRGHVRGLLCRACNVLLGCARDNVLVLTMAIRYLDQTSTTQQET